MNERIKQLCEQSKEYADKSTKDFTGDEPVCWMDYYTEKFAELIIQECMLCCERVISDPAPEDVDTWFDGGSQCIEEIKYRFGIES